VVGRDRRLAEGFHLSKSDCMGVRLEDWRRHGVVDDINKIKSTVAKVLGC
jgi:hypothetical protein